MKCGEGKDGVEGRSEVDKRVGEGEGVGGGRDVPFTQIPAARPLPPLPASSKLKNP
jgi:hypothetical protein